MAAAPLVPFLVWVTPIGVMIPPVQYMISNLDDWVNEELVRTGIDMENHGKEHHVWQNRTYAAEQSLAATVVQNGHVHTLTFAHGVYYGIYLERMQGGRFSVIMNTMQMFYGTLMDRLRAVVS